MKPAVGLELQGRYQLIERIALGGMGEVWRATDLRSGRMVAAKILRPELAGDEIFLSRLRAEATNSRGLRHPNLAIVLDAEAGPFRGRGAPWGSRPPARGSRRAPLRRRVPPPAPVSASCPPPVCPPYCALQSFQFRAMLSLPLFQGPRFRPSLRLPSLYAKGGEKNGCKQRPGV